MPNITAGVYTATLFVLMGNLDFLKIRSVATIWYGRMTSNNSSDVNTQYFVRIFSTLCLEKSLPKIHQIHDRLIIGLRPTGGKLIAVAGFVFLIAVSLSLSVMCVWRVVLL